MEIRKNLKSGESWLRGFYILLFALLYSIAEVVLWGIVVFQFGNHLITAQANHKLLDFSRSLNLYIYQTLEYLTYRNDTRPFPFADWPNEESDEAVVTEAWDQAEPSTDEISDDNEPGAENHQSPS